MFMLIIYSKPFIPSTWLFKNILWDHWYPCFGLLGLNARMGSLIHTWQMCTCYTFPKIRLWCNTCWSLGSMYDIQADLLHVSVNRPGLLNLLRTSRNHYLNNDLFHLVTHMYNNFKWYFWTCLSHRQAGVAPWNLDLFRLKLNEVKNFSWWIQAF